MITNYWFQGDTLFYTIKNQSDVGADTSWTSLLNEGLLVAEDSVAALAPDEERTLSFDFTYICTPPGDALEIVADGRDDVFESDEMNNLLVSVTCSGQPDLVIDGLQFNGSTISYIIKNVGGAWAAASWSRLRIDGTMVAEDSVTSLAPGEERLLAFEYSYSCSGWGDNLEIVADGRNQVTEGDETNNTLVAFLTCSPQVQADLTIDDIRLGGTISYRITNAGQAMAGDSVTRLRIDNAVVATGAVGPLGPGESRWLSFNYPYTCSPPGDIMEIIADGTSLVTEGDETNNTSTLFITCLAQPQPDLTIDGVRLGSTIFYSITNTGQAAAAATVTRLRIDNAVVATSAVGPLAAGESRWLSFIYAYTCSGPGDTMEVIADGTNLVAEGDETNNVSTLFITCLPSRSRTW